jgi:tRNA threonylcarbamoyladenosine biosynthesis protein TsaB
MRTLAIDTSGQTCSLALFEDERVLAERHELIGRGHAEAIMPWIAELPGGGRADAILVGCGPGSFTGVRVGVAVARALGLGWRVPVEGVSSLGLIAAQNEGSGDVLVAIEGGHGELFVQPFAMTPLRATAPLVSLTPEDAAARFDHPIVIGSAAERLVATRGHGKVVMAHPQASLALRLGSELRGWKPTPVYGRAPDAKAA